MSKRQEDSVSKFIPIIVIIWVKCTDYPKSCIITADKRKKRKYEPTVPCQGAFSTRLLSSSSHQVVPLAPVYEDRVLYSVT